MKLLPLADTDNDFPNIQLKKEDGREGYSRGTKSGKGRGEPVDEASQTDGMEAWRHRPPFQNWMYA